DLSMLYYLIIAIIISELFFSMWGYILTAGIILTGVFVIWCLNPRAEAIFLFLLTICILIGFFQLQSPFHAKTADRSDR
ncbi:MAG TPA: hypothetical protein VHP14_18880, partial [Anaerolineales bacterium]|nr:hypothetical protein [Anaerolineales bacterium]